MNYNQETRTLEFSFHELAFSLRTSGVNQYFFGETGIEISMFESVKKVLQVAVPESAKYFLRRYWTNSNYPEHILYSVPKFEEIMKINKQTTISEIEKKKLPDPLAYFIISDIF